MISSDQAERAVFFLRDSATAYGSQKGYQARCDANLRRVKALQMIERDGSLGDREASAYASSEYGTAIDELQKATTDVETTRALREAAVMLIGVFQTEAKIKLQGVNL